jgi:uncharacterized protein (DUF2141 family)
MSTRALLLWLLLAGNAAPATLDVEVAGLRSHNGVIRLCLTRDASHFPACDRDPHAQTLTAPAGNPLHLAGLPSGDYAIALFHDENGNGKLDRRLGIPSEGVGFSRNPRLMFGPPRFDAAAFPLPSGESEQTVKLRYFL